ncbi:uncharacterized protein TNCV_2939021 [Trichonephila clavipes]|nr:uncharacterized protein TNCV_2939021 [Trichonephila clavipes]
MRKQHKTWEKYYNQKRREVNIKVNDLVLVQTHFLSAAGRRVVGKFMPKFEGPYRVLEIRNNNLSIWKKGKRVTVNIDQVRVYHPRQSDTISLDSHVETLYEGQRSSNGSSRSLPEKSKRSRKTSNEESKGRKSNKGNAGWEDPRLKRKGSQSIAGPSHLIDARQVKPPTEGSNYTRAFGDGPRNFPNGGNNAVERRPVRSRQATAVRPCPYYLRSRVKEPEGIPEEQMSNGIDGIPQKNLKRRSLSMEALEGDPVDRSE